MRKSRLASCTPGRQQAVLLTALFPELESSLDALGPGVLTDDAVFVERLGDWVFLLLFLLSLSGFLSSLGILGSFGGGFFNSLGLGCTSAGLLALLLNLGHHLLLHSMHHVRLYKAQQYFSFIARPDVQPLGLHHVHGDVS